MKAKNKNKIEKDFIYEISNFELSIKFNSEDLDDDIKIDIMKDINVFQKSKICLDKSYVLYDENNRTDVFIALEGWENLSNILMTTNFGHDANAKQLSIIEQAFKELILGFIYSILDMYYPDYSDCIQLDFKKNSKIDIEIFKDDINN